MKNSVIVLEGALTIVVTDKVRKRVRLVAELDRLCEANVLSYGIGGYS